MLTKLNALLLQLQSHIIGQKLSGQVLQRRTGMLASSVRVIPAKFSGTKIVGAIEAGRSAALYAGVHEYGGSHAYQILSVKARALSFVLDGRRVFAKSVLHPPARQRAFMRPSLDENAASIQEELSEALNREINE